MQDTISLDGDECIVGLMSKHFIEGKELPLFFYGQSYGFSFLEVIFIGVSYLFLGVTALAVKIGVLSLWLVGVIFLFLSFFKLNKSKIYYLPLLITLLIVCFPSWTVWAMKARGGYVSAFTLSSIIIYLVLISKTKLIHYAFIGILTVMLYQAQPLWIPGVITILFYKIYKHWSFKTFGAIIITAVLTGVGFYIYKLRLSNYWSPSVISFENFNLDNVTQLPKSIYNNLHGTYSFHTVQEPNFEAKLIGFLFLLLIPIILLKNIIDIFKRNINPYFLIFSISVFLTVGYMFLIGGRNPRYLLPLSGFLIFTFYFYISQVKLKENIKVHGLVVLILFAFNSNFDVQYHPGVNEINVKNLIPKLKEEKIEYVFSTDPNLQWKISFYSNESIIARFQPSEDRYMPYIGSVNYGVVSSPSKIAIVGYLDNHHRVEKKNLHQIDNLYFIKKDVSKKTLRAYGFNF